MHTLMKSPSIGVYLSPTHGGMIRKPSKEQNALFSSLSFGCVVRKMTYLAAALPDAAISEAFLNMCRGARDGVSALMRAELLLSNLAGAQLLS